VTDTVIEEDTAEFRDGERSWIEGRREVFQVIWLGGHDVTREYLEC
jgi:hypothetical protein